MLRTIERSRLERDRTCGATKDELAVARWIVAYVCDNGGDSSWMGWGYTREGAIASAAEECTRSGITMANGHLVAWEIVEDAQAGGA